MAKKYVFKKSLFSFMDMLKTKKLPLKALDNIKKQPIQDIKCEYNVNKLAEALHPKKQYLYIHDIINESHDTRTFILKPIDKNKQVAFFRAGQFLSIGIKINNTIIARPYSISSSPYDALVKNFYAITIKLKPNGLVSNYFFNKMKIGDQLESSGPEGNFYYDDLRDAKNVLAICGGSGITPFLSMAKAIDENNEDFKLTIIYACRNEKDILFKKDLDNLSKQNKNIKVIYIISQPTNVNKNKDYLVGHIDLALIKQYYNKGDSIFMCGSKRLNEHILKEIIPLKIERKFLRWEAHNDIGLPTEYNNYSNVGNKQTYKIIVRKFNEVKTISASASETILVSLQRAKISMETKCLSGECSWCRFKLIKGEVFIPDIFDKRRKADKYNDIYFSCCSFPITDLEIEAY